jgi:hypothetical protein
VADFLLAWHNAEENGAGKRRSSNTDFLESAGLEYQVRPSNRRPRLKGRVLLLFSRPTETTETIWKELD